MQVHTQYVHFCRQLEEELQFEKTLHNKERDDLKEEIVRLKEDNDRQQQLLSVNLSKSPVSQNEAYLHSEINRLISENLVSQVVLWLKD